MLQDILTVLRTELVDHSRDRRSLFAAFAYALFGPVFLVVGLNFAVGEITRDETAVVAVYGAANAPTLVSELERRGLNVERRDGDEAIPTLGSAQVAIRIPADYAEKWTAGRSAEITLFRDEARQSSLRASRQVAGAIRAFGTEVAQARLLARGVPGETVAPIAITEANVAVTGVGTVQIANMLLYFFLLAPFFIGMSMAIDSTAGERERRSLRPLLAQPVTPLSLILGKWANATMFSVIGTGVTIVLGVNLLRFAPLEQLGITMQLTATTQLLMWLTLLPVCLAVSACQVLLALLAKNFKEAQTYIQLFSFLPVILVVFTSFSGRDPEGAQKLAPIMGHSDVLRRLVSEGAYEAGQGLIVSLITLAVCAAALWYAQQKLRDERILTAA